MIDNPGQKTAEDVIELYVHRPVEERIEVREVASTLTVGEAIDACEGERVWLEETDVEIDLTVTVVEAELRHRSHVHVNRCTRVKTSVTFNGATKERDFHVSTRIERVFNWAVSKQGFNLTPTDATEHTLQVAGTTIQPDAGDHIGSFTNAHCAVSFGLVAKIRNEG